MASGPFPRFRHVAPCGRPGGVLGGWRLGLWTAFCGLRARLLVPVAGLAALRVAAGRRLARFALLTRVLGSSRLRRFGSGRFRTRTPGRLLGVALVVRGVRVCVGWFAGALRVRRLAIPLHASLAIISVRSRALARRVFFRLARCGFGRAFARRPLWGVARFAGAVRLLLARVRVGLWGLFRVGTGRGLRPRTGAIGPLGRFGVFVAGFGFCVRFVRCALRLTLGRVASLGI